MVNGKAIDTTAQTVAELCTEQGYTDAKIATALNNDFIAKAERANTPLNEKDVVEIVAPRQGG